MDSKIMTKKKIAIKEVVQSQCKDSEIYILYLFVAGATARSADAIKNVTRMCEKHLKGKCELKVIDIYQQPELARQEQIIAVPTLVKKQPPPVKRFIGDVSDAKRILSSL
jgi:circadian clock protein KaiB